MIQWFKKRGTLSFFLVALLVLLIGGAYLRSMPALSAEAETYQNLKKFGEILDLIERNYVEEVDPNELLQGAIEGMMKTLDPHSTYMTEEMYRELQVDTRGVFGGLGIVISMRNEVITVVAPLEDTPAFKAGIITGDAIVRIDGTDTAGMTIMEAVQKLRGPKGTDVTISIMRDDFDQPKDFTITRDIIKVQSVKHRVLHDDIGYIRISSFQENTTDDLKKTLAALRAQETPLRGIILDLRNNPGGLLDQAVSVSDLFLKTGVIVSTKGRGDKNIEKVYRARDYGTEPEAPMIVLVNGGSASGSEILAGALRDNNRALLLGTQTFGKGVMQVIIPLRDGSAVKLTTAKYFTPSGVSIQAKGLSPDFVVEYRRPDQSPDTERLQLREKDLEGHIRGDYPQEDESIPNGPGDFYQPDTGEFIIDNQMQRAIDLIRSWEMFQKTQKG
ncbi:MAG: S41 family peptidase [Syntrophales bacterium]|jgi:carboxyl-terminal processing protease|nr:S41 family peptidase [Syntrophales bacterium]MCK9528878.1 S41 family peptidase [Syntrophales bacterium]MDX9922958.1 S41 family peptidase [Syntrophales bacterium]